MALVKQSTQVPPTVADLLPFTGVNNGTARLLIAIAAEELATLKEGDVVYVESFRDYWKWLPTSIQTADNTTFCKPTVVPGAGRFERLWHNPSPDWLLQGSWTVDSTAANEEGEGTVKTDTELARRLGIASGGAAVLTIPTDITYAQDPSTITDLEFRIENGGSLTVNGTPEDVITGVTLTAVTTRNRATDTRQDVTGVGLGAPHVGLIMVITASATPAKVGAAAPIVKNLGGGKVVVDQFVVADPGNFPGSSVVTPAVNDVVKVINPTTLSCGKFKVDTSAQFDFYSPSPLTNVVVVNEIRFNCNNVNFGGGNLIIGNIYTQFYRTIIQDGTVWVNNDALIMGFNQYGGLMTGFTDIFGNAFNAFYVGFLDGVITLETAEVLIFACTAQNASFFLQDHSHAYSNDSSYFDSTWAQLVFVPVDSAWYAVSGGGFDWGTNNANFAYKLGAAGVVQYGTMPTVNAGLGVGRETSVGGTDKLYTALPYVEGANLAEFVPTV